MWFFLKSLTGFLEGFKVKAVQVAQNKGSESLQESLVGFLARLNPVTSWNIVVDYVLIDWGQATIQVLETW